MLTKTQLALLRDKCDKIINGLYAKYENGTTTGMLAMAHKASYDADDYVWAKLCMDLFQQIHYLEHPSDPSLAAIVVTLNREIVIREEAAKLDRIRWEAARDVGGQNTEQAQAWFREMTANDVRADALRWAIAVIESRIARGTDAVDALD